MKKSIILSLFFITILAFALANAADINVKQETKVYFFYGDGCPHCINVENSGILEKIKENITLIKLEIYHNTTNSEKFIEFSNNFGLTTSKRGIPFAVIECNGNLSYLLGDTEIMNKIQDKIDKCENQINIIQNKDKLTLGTIIIAALVDSINPCAFGVLIFLLICLLNMGSAKRALKAGLLYTFVVFLTYFLAGLGLFRVIQSFSFIPYYIYLIAGLLVLFLGVTQFIDIYFPGKFISLRIPVKAKPLIEKMSEKATIPAIILLGILVSLFELPCTGGIYIAILTTMSINKTFAIGYLLLYNLIFVLPLIIITLALYKGTSLETLQRFTQHEKKWMKFASGIVMTLLGLYILFNL